MNNINQWTVVAEEIRGKHFLGLPEKPLSVDEKTLLSAVPTVVRFVGVLCSPNDAREIKSLWKF